MKFRTSEYKKSFSEVKDLFYSRRAECYFDFDGCDASISMEFIEDYEDVIHVDVHFDFMGRSGSCFWEIERYHESFYDYAKSCGIPSSVALLYGNLIDGFIECEDLDDIVYYIFPWAEYDEEFLF